MGFSQARILESIAISSSKGSSWPRDWNYISNVSCIADRFFTLWAIRKDPLLKVHLRIRFGGRGVAHDNFLLASLFSEFTLCCFHRVWKNITFQHSHTANISKRELYLLCLLPHPYLNLLSPLEFLPKSIWILLPLVFTRMELCPSTQKKTVSHDRW